jgi:hypothetical protein
MVAVMLNLRILIYGWIATNFGLFISSGYLKRLASALSMKGMKEFVEVHTVIFPFQSLDIKYYDITEFIVSYLIAVLFFFIIKRMEQSRINYKVYQTF